MLILAFVCTLATICDTGCKTTRKTTLDPAGPYHGDTFLFNADRVIVDSKEDISAFLKWELQNRPALVEKKLQTVTATADTIRSNAPLWFRVAVQSRNQYSNAVATASGPSTVTASSNSLQSAISSLETQTLSTRAITNSVKLEN